MSSRYAQVDRCVWVDVKFLSLSKPAPNAQTLFLWLLTSPESGIVPGLIRIGLAGMAEAIDWSTMDTAAYMDELVAAGMARVDWKARLVWLPKALSRNMPRQAQNMSPWAKAWSEIPECQLKAEAWQGMFDTLATKKDELAESFAKLCPHPLVSVPTSSASQAREAKGGAKPHPEPGAKPRDNDGAKGGANPATHKHDHDHDHNQEQKQKRPAAAADGCQLETSSPPPIRQPADPMAQAALARLLTIPALAPIATPGYAEIIAGSAHASGKTLALMLQAIDELALDAKAGAEDNQFVSPKELGKQASRFVANVRPKRPSAPVPGQDLTPDQVKAEQARRGAQQGTAGPPKRVVREEVPDGSP